MMVVSIIIPTYNESKNLPILVEEIFNYIDKSAIDAEIIFVDDNSPDGTGVVAEELSRKYPIKVVHRSGKLGLGSAVREGFQRSDRAFLGVMDADLSHDPRILNDMINALHQCDIAIGSRFALGSEVEKWVWWRKIISTVGVWVTRRLARGVKDPLSGYFFLKKTAIDEVKLETEGYKILFEILVKGEYANVREFSYNFRMRKYSSSKLSWKEHFLFLSQILEYSWYRITHK